MLENETLQDRKRATETERQLKEKEAKRLAEERQNNCE